MRWKLDDLFILRAIIEQGGISAAAARLKAPKSTISKVLARLEADLGLRLVERNSRKIKITNEGQEFYKHARKILEQAEETDAIVSGFKAIPSGNVTLALPAAFCREFVAPNLSKFQKKYPNVVLNLVITTQFIDVFDEQFDMAIVVGMQTSSELVQRVLLQGKQIWVASPQYLKNGFNDEEFNPETHVQIFETRYSYDALEFHFRGHSRKFQIDNSIFKVNDPMAVIGAVENGMGISFLPQRYCQKSIKNGSLVEVWKKVAFDDEAGKLSLVYPSRRHISPRHKAVIEFMESICSQ